MFKKKITKDYTQKLNELSATQDVKLHLKYKSLSPVQYMDLISKWDEYYKKSWISAMGDNFRTQYKAYLAGQFDIVKELSEVSKVWMLEGQRMICPSEEDPRVIARRMSVTTYENIKNINQSSEYEI